MKAIAAMDLNRGIGKDDKIPWRVKEDFQWFKEFTTGQTLVVGWKTFNSLPRLKGRNGIVLNKKWDGNIMYDMQNTPFDSFIIKNPYHAGLYGEEEVKFNPSEHADAIVAGGAKTYELLMSHITEFYVTHINGIYECDTFMSKFEDQFSDKIEIIKEFSGGHKVIKYKK